MAGDPGLLVLAALLLMATALLLVSAATRDGMNPFVATALVALAAAACSDRFVPRPQLVSYLGVAYLFDSVSRARKSGRIPWDLLPAQILWNNAHGAVLGLLFGGFLVLGGACPALRIRDRLALFGGLLLASLVHPQGVLPLRDNVSHLVAGGLYRTTVREWLPLLDPLQQNLPQAAATWLIVALALGGAAAALRRRENLRRPGPVILLILAGLAPLAAVRNRDLAGLLLAPALAGLGVGIGPALRRPAASMVAAAVALALCVLPAAGVLRYPPLLPLRPGLSTATLPRAAVSFLKEEPVGSRIFNVYDHGGYLVHELAPARRVFIDGRYFVYGESLYRNYLEIRDGAPDAAARLDAAGADLLLLRYPAADGYMGLARLAAAWPNWRLVFWDDETLLYARLGAAPAAWFDAHGYGPGHPLVTAAHVSDPGWWRSNMTLLLSECLRARLEAPGALRPRLTLALALDYAGRDAQSAEAYREVLAMSPASRPAREGLARLEARNPGGISGSPTLGDLEREVGRTPAPPDDLPPSGGF